MPQPRRLVSEVRERAVISAYTIVGIMPAYFLTQLAVLVRHWLMTVLFAPISDYRESCTELLSLGLALDRVPSAPRLPPVMGEAEEVEGLRLVFAFPGV